MAEEYHYKTDPIVEYLAYFNQIDKHFDKVLGIDAFLPYNEKIKRIIETKNPLAWLVKMHRYELKFFGELRNHLTHGIKMDGHTYAIPSPYALAKIHTMAKIIKQPPSVLNVFRKKVYRVRADELLANVLPQMKNNNFTHVPVYDKNNRFVGVLTESMICFWLAQQFDNKTKMLEDIRIAHIPLENSEKTVQFIPSAMNIYQVDELFASKRENGQKIGVMLITDHGKSTEKILGLVTGGDAAVIDKFVLH